MEFLLTERKLHILVGNGECKGRGMNLICNAKVCSYNGVIELTGYIKCKKCSSEKDFKVFKDFPVTYRCPECQFQQEFKKTDIVWTTWVVSRHRRNKHLYYNKSCWDQMYIDSD